jgi:hypothetical protein
VREKRKSKERKKRKEKNRKEKKGKPELTLKSAKMEAALKGKN